MKSLEIAKSNTLNVVWKKSEEVIGYGMYLGRVVIGGTYKIILIQDTDLISSR